MEKTIDKDKMVRVTAEDWKYYDKLAKAMTKQVGVRIPVNGAIRLAIQDYIKSHPDLGIKLK